VQRAHAARHRRAQLAAHEIEQTHDLGAMPGIDVDDERRDVREDEVQAEPRAALRIGLRLRSPALAARAPDVRDHVALRQRAERVADRHGDRALVATEAQHGATAGRRRIERRRVEQRVHQQLVDDVREPVHERPAGPRRLGPGADLADRGAPLGIAADDALADARPRRQVLLEAEQIARRQLLRRDAEIAIARVLDEVADRRLGHQREQRLVIEVVADDDHRRTEVAQPLAGRLTRRAIDHHEHHFAAVRGQRVARLDRVAGGRERVADVAAHPRIVAHAKCASVAHRRLG
jgi:hypothetical protein